MTTQHDGLTYEILEIPAAKARVLYPMNTFTAEIMGNHVKLTISSDWAGLDSVKRKLEALREMMAVQIDQPAIFDQPRDMVAGDLLAHPQTKDHPHV